MALLQAALGLIGEVGATLSAADTALLRRNAEQLVRAELTADRRYAELSRRLLGEAARAAERADGRAVDRLISRLPEEDARLGRTRPQVVEALNTTLQNRLSDARRLRLLRDQWALRRPTYRQYQQRVDSSMLLLAKSTAALEAIRALEGPHPERLVALRTQLRGGAERLSRMHTPDYLRDVHDRLIGAWRFAENATTARFNAVSMADSSAAWEASSSAAGALMMLSRVQQDLQALLSPPRLQ
jgi:hypothetical protein